MTMEDPWAWGIGARGFVGGPEAEGTGEGEGLEGANRKNKLEENLKNLE